MSLGDTFENDLLKLILQGIAIANLADNAAATPLGSLYIALHTADPGEAGVQTTNEISYTGYVRQAVARSALGWSVVGSSASPLANIVFGAMTAGSGGIVTHVSVGTAFAGAGKILVSGAVSPTIPVAIPVVPILTTAMTISFD